MKNNCSTQKQNVLSYYAGYTLSLADVCSYLSYSC